ncbi:hypothetical protein CERSUDRAFT_89691 [Gelatoporia subvermispora B]|uniref:Uncharacterized protein n=1 Tax=Ceriporiopsis subvermispora (strain B) TaxID=914234 RepID=M2QW46_CERS8|nr:hypothetical protein CERSUDRAFT_89691 [Gelatoporia subvermispora B]
MSEIGREMLREGTRRCRRKRGSSRAEGMRRTIQVCCSYALLDLRTDHASACIPRKPETHSHARSHRPPETPKCRTEELSLAAWNRLSLRNSSQDVKTEDNEIP